MKVRFEQAAKEDVAALIEVQNQAFHADYEKYGYCPGYGHTAETMGKILASSQVYKIMQGDEVVGNIIFRREEDGWYRLGGLCVIPAWQNKGVGRQAMEFLFRLVPGAPWFLETPADSGRNLHFYESQGFEVIETFLDGGVEVVHMEHEE